MFSGRVGSLQRLDTAIEKFQEFAGLKVTGELDSETVEMMQKPRCGVKDFIDEDEDIDSPRIKVRGVLKGFVEELISLEAMRNVLHIQWHSLRQVEFILSEA